MIRKLATTAALACGVFAFAPATAHADVIGGDVTVNVTDVLSCLAVAVVDSAKADCSG